MDKGKTLSRDVMDINILISKTIERKIKMLQLNHYRKTEKYLIEKPHLILLKTNKNIEKIILKYIPHHTDINLCMYMHKHTLSR